MAEIGTEATLPLFERSGVASAAIFGDLAGIADRRTLEILERRSTSNPHRRGWLVRRLLVLADVVGLVLAFVAAELVFGAGAGAGNRATSVDESLLLLATLPGWIVIAGIVVVAALGIGPSSYAAQRYLVRTKAAPVTA